jgi:hypothetical protein
VADDRSEALRLAEQSLRPSAARLAIAGRAGPEASLQELIGGHDVHVGTASDNCHREGLVDAACAKLPNFMLLARDPSAAMALSSTPIRFPLGQGPPSAGPG